MLSKFTLLHYARLLNGAFAKNEYKYCDRVFSRVARDLATRIYGEKFGDYKLVLQNARGDKLKADRKNLPLEVLMPAYGFLAMAWTCDIYRRKARDRRCPRMAGLYKEFEAFLLGQLKAIEEEVQKHEDSKYVQRQYKKHKKFCERAKMSKDYDPRTNTFRKKNREKGVKNGKDE